MVAVRDKVARMPPLVDYDHVADVLYVTLGRPVPAEGEDGPRGTVLRYSLADGSPVGVTVIGFSHNGWERRVDELSRLIAGHLRIDYVPVLMAIERGTKR